MMKGIVGVGAAGALALGTAAPATAQAPDMAANMAEQAKAMSALAWMDGRWAGDAQVSGPGGPHALKHTERAGPLIGDTIRIVEGRSFEPDGRPANFNALAVISYDVASKGYRFHAFAQGRAGDFPMTLTPDGYSYDVPAGPMTLRYAAVHDAQGWRETGDLVAPNAPPRRVFEMRLKRLGDSDWPAAGHATADWAR